MILAIDTATRFISIALHDGVTIIAESSWHTKNHHTVELTPALERILLSQSIAVNDLGAIAVPLGPGSYTGLRIGMSVAKGLSMSASEGLPLIGIPTLDITASAQPPLCERLCAVSQAGRKRINAMFYNWDRVRWEPDGSAFISTWADLIEKVDTRTLISGEIDAEARRLLQEQDENIIIGSPAGGLRRAGYLAEIAWEKYRRGETSSPEHLAPIYLS